MALTVANVVQRAKDVLMEVSVDGIRWTNDELVRWLNEAYEALVGLRPDAATVNDAITLTEGSRQTLPATGIRLIEVVRNTAAGSNKSAIRQMDRKTLDWGRPKWHGETPTEDIEFFIFDENDPTTFYTYPPATATAEVELIYSVVPSPHTDYDTDSGNSISVKDHFAPALVDYILYRAFGKDNEAPNGAARSATHYQMFQQGLGIRQQVATQISPNIEQQRPRFDK